AHTGPGVPNWLDPAGHTEGMMHFRAVWCSSAPQASAEVVAVAELRSHLPGDHPVATPADRAEASSERRRLAQQRFSR
ncbi:MAG: hypothetical protein KDB21_05475, partial [Acidimicrobiales bacterium]|nr:hypothetical protein [Acidimicrobiales bacterium]